MTPTLSLYLHIPFCKSKCDYCDFLSFPGGEELFLPYKNALIEEIKNCPELEDSRIETVFFGGGTPTLLPAGFLCEILEAVYKKNVRANPEISVECNPETVTPGYLPALKAAGVNRLSIGLQSSHDRLLKKLGRIHNVRKFEDAYNMAVQSGFNNINIDLMFALPDQTVKDFEQTLEYVISLNPAHISAYGLMIEPGTPIFAKRESLSLPDEDTDREMYYLTNRILRESSYNRYEISNFSKEGFECEHNKAYWTYKNYIGLGLGSHSFIEGSRFNNLKELDGYISAKGDAQILRQNHERIDKSEAMSEFMFLGLRMSEGVSPELFESRFGEDIFFVYGEEIKKLMESELLEQNKKCLFLTDKGVDLSNIVFSEFFD